MIFVCSGNLATAVSSCSISYADMYSLVVDRQVVTISWVSEGVQGIGFEGNLGHN